mmetsp:Transcript_24636/g.69259  ORF Transcript_24636/g.69259 Transcript_24636/m.69259 type:complete len:490 (-) Transcript_24636:533-2002(-)
MVPASPVLRATELLRPAAAGTGLLGGRGRQCFHHDVEDWLRSHQLHHLQRAVPDAIDPDDAVPGPDLVRRVSRVPLLGETTCSDALYQDVVVVVPKPQVEPQAGAVRPAQGDGALAQLRPARVLVEGARPAVQVAPKARLRGLLGEGVVDACVERRHRPTHRPLPRQLRVRTCLEQRGCDRQPAGAGRVLAAGPAEVLELGRAHLDPPHRGVVRELPLRPHERVLASRGRRRVPGRLGSEQPAPEPAARHAADARSFGGPGTQDAEPRADAAAHRREVQELLGAGAAHDLLLQGEPHQLAHLIVVLLWDRRRLRGDDLDDQGGYVVGLEGLLEGQELVEHHPQRPDVRLAAVRQILADLWRQVRGRPYDRLGRLPGLQDLGDAEVAQLGRPGLHEEDVLALDVPVQDPLVVDVLQPEQAVPEHGHRLGLAEVLPRVSPPLHLRGEVPAVGELEDDVQHHVLHEGVEVRDDVRVREAPQHINLRLCTSLL